MSFENGYALLIAVDENRVPDYALPNVKKDVDALSQVLVSPERCGFPAKNVRVVSGKNATREGILNETEWLKEQVDKNKDATAFLYYSGHGWRSEQANPPEYFLIPYDVRREDLLNSALKAGDFAAKVELLRPSRLLVILDCCHSAGMGVKNLAESPSDFLPFAMPTHWILKEKGLSPSAGAKGLDELKEGSGRAVLSSSSGEQSSYLRKDGKMSIFTYHLIEALTGHAQPQEGARQVLVSDVMGHVWRKVPVSAMHDWGKKQNPDYQVSGNFPVALLLGGKGWSKGVVAPDPLNRHGPEDHLVKNMLKMLEKYDNEFMRGKTTVREFWEDDERGGLCRILIYFSSNPEVTKISENEREQINNVLSTVPSRLHSWELARISNQNQQMLLDGEIRGIYAEAMTILRKHQRF